MSEVTSTLGWLNNGDGTISLYVGTTAVLTVDSSGLTVSGTMDTSGQATFTVPVAPLPGTAWVVANSAPSAHKALAQDLIDGGGYGDFVKLCDGTADDVQIQEAIDAVYNSTRGGKVILSDGTFNISDPVGWDGSENNIRTQVHVQGMGRRNTSIFQDDDAKDVFEVRSGSNNVRDTMLSDLTLQGGRYGLRLEWSSYNLFSNVTLDGQTVAGVYSVNGARNTYLQNCWWVNQTGNVYESGGSDSIVFADCVIGESTGGFIIDGHLYADNCQMILLKGDQQNGSSNTSIQDIGQSVFNLVSGAQLTMTNCHVNLHSAFTGEAIIAADRNRYVRIHDCVFDDDGSDAHTFVVVRRQEYSNSVLSTWDVQRNQIHLNNGAKFWDRTGSQNQTEHSIISNNEIRIDEGDSITVDDRLLDPQYDNRVEGNKVVVRPS